jgi:asparagine synthase (glutamine-hydrolysing)
MTALAGLWSRRGEMTDRAVGRMLDGQASFGPEPAVRRTLDTATLGRRLYPLVPEDEFDRGPVTGGNDTLLLAADARIDNRDEIAAALGLSSADLARMAEPQLLMAVVERWDIAGLCRVVGAFAVMLWDERRGVLTLARDPLGERPLFYHRGDGFVAAASMPRGLHAHPDIPYAPSDTATADFLAILPEGDESFFAGITRVRPGHALAIDADGVTATRLWTPERKVLRLKPDDYVEGLRFEFDRAVAARTRRIDGAVGTHLSAGLDSASVAVTAARMLAPETLHAFTAVPGPGAPVPDGAIDDEGPLAAHVAALHPNIAHVAVRGEGRSPLPLLDRHFDLYQRPVANPWNAVWGEAINDAARGRGVRVLLTGQLGNFTLSHDGVPHLPQLLGAGRLVALARMARQLRVRGWRNRRIGAATLGPFLSPALWTWLTDRYGDSLALNAHSALRQDALTDLDARAATRGIDLSYRPWRDGRAMRLWGLDRVDMGPYNKGTLAGWGLDLRDPTADRRLIEWALSVPDEQYILGGEPRSLARRAFADRLPPALVGEHRRGYQAADWHVGPTAALAELTAELDGIERCHPADAVIDVDRLRTLVLDWPDFAMDDPRWNEPAITDRYRSMLLRGVAAGHFLRRAARSN